MVPTDFIALRKKNKKLDLAIIYLKIKDETIIKVARLFQYGKLINCYEARGF